MAKRTRLPKKSNVGRKDRLVSAIRAELKSVSDARLRDYLSAKKSLVARDPLLATYHELALAEQERRVALSKQWGKVEPKLPPEGMLMVSEILGAPARTIRKALTFYGGIQKRLLKGQISADVIFATDYVVDKLTDFRDRGKNAKLRWDAFAHGLGLIGKNESDFVNDGYEVKRRFDHDLGLDDLKIASDTYNKGYSEVLIIPIMVDGKRQYSLMVRGVK